MRLGIMKHIVMVAVMVFACVAVSHAEGVPNTFSTGTTALASEVNDNFTFVNYGNIVLKDANGVEIGSLIDWDWVGNILIMTPEGYTARYIGQESNNLQSTNNVQFYPANSCSGTGYISITSPRGSVWRYSYDGGSIWYIPKNAAVVPAGTAVYGGAGCTSSGVTSVPMLEILANDPAVTGISSIQLNGPVSIERR